MNIIKVLVVEPISKHSLARIARACRKNDWKSHLLITKSNKLISSKDDFDAITTFESLNMDTADVLGLLNDEDFSAVIPACEFAVPLSEKIAEAKGLYHNPLPMLKYYRDKSEMRKIFSEIGLSQPKVIIEVDDASQIGEIDWESLSYPLVAKPVEAAGSVLVRICSDKAQARQAVMDILTFSESRVTNLTFKTKALLEEAVLGPEYSIEVLVSGSKAVHRSITTKMLSPEPYCHEVGHIVGADIDPDIVRQVDDHVSRLICGWKIHNGVLHIEYKVKQGNIYVIEAAVRIAGDMISELVNLQYNVDLEESFILSRSNLPISLETRANSDGVIHGIRFIFDEYDLTAINQADFIQVVDVQYSELGSGIATDYNFSMRKGYALISCNKANFNDLVSLIQMERKNEVALTEA